MQQQVERECRRRSAPGRPSTCCLSGERPALGAWLMWGCGVRMGQLQPEAGRLAVAGTSAAGLHALQAARQAPQPGYPLTPHTPACAAAARSSPRLPCAAPPRLNAHPLPPSTRAAPRPCSSCTASWRMRDRAWTA